MHIVYIKQPNGVSCRGEHSLPGCLRNSDAVGVFVFPRLLVCLECGSSSFMTPAPNWRSYALLTNRLPERTASIASSARTPPQTRVGDVRRHELIPCARLARTVQSSVSSISLKPT